MKTNTFRRHKTIHIKLKRYKPSRVNPNKKSVQTVHSTSPSTNDRSNSKQIIQYPQVNSSYLCSQSFSVENVATKEDGTCQSRVFKMASENVNSSKLINLDFSLKTKSSKQPSIHPDIEFDHPFVTLKKRRKKIHFGWKLLVFILICLLIVGIILAISIPLLMRQELSAPTTTTMPTTIPTPICSLSTHNACSTIMFQYLNPLFLPPNNWMSVSCCYIASLSNQLTFEIAIEDDLGGYWILDDISAKQSHGELISNGGFESNMTNWTSITYPNASSTIYTDSQPISCQSGLACLYATSLLARSYVKQTFSITTGENTLISFWWNYFPALGFPSGVSELLITLT